jgi:polysaccharide export outer membrane protein
MRLHGFQVEGRPASRRARTLAFLLLLLPIGLLVSGCAGVSGPIAVAPGPQLAAVPQAAPAPQPDLDTLMYAGGPARASTLVAAPAAASAVQVPGAEIGSSYTLDSGDRLRIVVFGQDGLSNSYIVDAAGNVTMPLIGAVPARGTTTAELARAVTARLRNGFIREPHLAIEIESYRPFFILGEVTYPGQYPYVPNMTVETAIAIAGGFTPRAYRSDAKITRNQNGQTYRVSAPLISAVRPGDTITIDERWF